jgi:hypothetical protein
MSNPSNPFQYLRMPLQKNKNIQLLSPAQNALALLNETVHCCTPSPLLYELKSLIYSRLFGKRAH